MALLKIPTWKEIKLINISFLFVLLLVAIIASQSCNTTEPVNNEKLYIELADVSCTESWLKVETTGINLPAELKLYRDNELRKEINVNEKSTVIYDSLLSPSQCYKYQVKLPGITSEEITVTTMDTTSHDFSWESFTFGEHATSTLYDVAIIDENNIWAVGAIYLKDSLGQPDPHAYNAVHWDGEEWEYKRLYYTAEGNNSTGLLRAVYAFNSNNVWFGVGNIIHWNGEKYNSIKVGLGISINKIWGTSSENLYVVGDNGNIAVYDGSNWQKIESGTDEDLKDIWGIPDRKLGYNKYLAAGNSMLILDENDHLSTIKSDSKMDIISVWGKSNNLIYTAGGEGVALFKNSNWEKIDNHEINTIYRIKGQGYNDVFGISSLGTILHFNGSTWRAINIPLINVLLRLDVKENIIVGIGWQGEKAAITIIRRN